MKPIHDLVWLPESLCAGLAAELHQRFSEWTSTWGLPAAGALVVQGIAAHDPPLAPDTEDLLAPPSTAWRIALAQALFKVPAAESAVLEGAILKVLAKLTEPLRADFAPEAAPALSSFHPGHRGVTVSVELLGRRCGFYLDVAQLRRSGWLSRPTVPPLNAVNLEHALATVPIPLVAELGRATLSVADLLQLSAGDVLVLNETLAASLQLVAPGCSLALTAHLGATADSSHRAARIQSHSN